MPAQANQFKISKMAAIETSMDMTSEEILAYWTPERIQSAVPVDQFLQMESYEVQSTGALAALGDRQVTVVPSDKLTTFPYQCVGKLYFTLKNTRTWTTAYHIGGNKLLTVAHAVVATGSTQGSKAYASALAFIPAMTDKNDNLGKNYGYFPQVQGGPGQAYFPDPNFDPANMKAEYDICTVLLGTGSKGKKISEVLPPIEIINNKQYTAQTEWNTIGYPVTNQDGKMCEISGKYVQNSLSSNTVQKYGNAPHGMSGGPWIFLGPGNKANGVQAGNATSSTDISPYFRDPWST